jgi:hypothetical protein
MSPTLVSVEGVTAVGRSGSFAFVRRDITGGASHFNVTPASFAQIVAEMARECVVVTPEKDDFTTVRDVYFS